MSNRSIAPTADHAERRPHPVRAASVGAAWVALTSTAWAAPRQEQEAPAVKEYVLSWTIVVLCTALGLITVCRPGKRSDKARAKVEE